MQPFVKHLWTALMSLKLCFNTSMLQVYLRPFREFKKQQLSLMLMMIVMTTKTMGILDRMQKKEGKRKANAVDNPFSPKKKGRNPMVKQVSRVLLHIPSFPVEKQKKIIIACMALHNFIRDSALSDELFQMCDEDEEYMPEVDSSEEEEVHNSGPSSDDVDMCAFRDFIANSLMADRG